MTEDQLIESIVHYFKTFIFETHITSSLIINSKLKNYKINPIVVKYLSKILVNDYTPEGVAKALFYPRVLGTSINTSFGTRIQSMFIDLNIAEGSLIKGMDIEFTDQIDGRRKWCQLKSGPNTINSEDVAPIIQKFTSIINLARTNRVWPNISNNDFIIGVLYGDFNELNGHYSKINETHPVIIGADFWHRVTGFENIYTGLVTALHTTINNLDTKNLIEVGCATLADEIRESELFDFTVPD